MRKVTYTDKRGFKRVTMVRDNDPDDFAQQGVPVPMINIEDLIDLDFLKEIHNALVDREILSYNDVVSQQNGVTSVVSSAVRRRVIEKFKMLSKEA